MQLNYLSLFSGAGGGDLAFQHLLDGFRCVGYIDNESYCQRVIRQRQKDGLLDEAPIYGDIRTFISEGYAEAYQGMVDLIIGGWPCNQISYANISGEGLCGEHSGLWKEMAEVVRKIRPRYVFLENSPGITIRGLGDVLRDLAKSGYDAEYDCISATISGADHKRERWWLFATNTPKIRRKYTVNGESPGNIKRRLISQVSIKGSIIGNQERLYEKICSSDFVRKANGIPDRVDRVKACGEAWFPQVAATAWEILS